MRQFILEKQTVKNGLVSLEGKDFRYLRQVLRVKVGDMLNVRLPDGKLQNTTVAKIDDKTKKVTLQFCATNSDDKVEKSITRGVQSSQLEGKLPLVEYWLFQFLPKAQKLEQIVRQATECGVAFIIPIIGEYSEKNSLYALEGNKKERIERIIKEARQQSGSPVDTKILSPMTLQEALELWNQKNDEDRDLKALGFVLSERDDCKDNLKKVISENSGAGRLAIAVGSEGGISPEEVSLLEEKGLFHPIHFAVNILRCETAALYGIAAVQSAIN
ncbi:MAG: 16S rRNA (uracil(1498)-N(3))-methyltransferase [Treponema sp.]|nr:16S rRNA (uracil(1498)-N(3))-methyltransferase [Treponema sp.]